MGLKMKQKIEIDFSSPLKMSYFGATVEIVGAIVKENRIESFKAKKHNSSFDIPNKEDECFKHKAYAAKIKKEYPEYFI